MKESAGLLLYRRVKGRLEVLLVHPGGPFWRSKDAGAWTIPKGEVGAGEDALACARRELREEIGLIFDGPARALPPVRQKGGKLVRAWAAEADFDPATLRSNTFEMEWPPKSGKRASFPEVDRAEWCDLETARTRINPAQIELLNALTAILNS
ncbi:MAG: NUDIX domain-containing protein [Vicinamibacterales bacterium]